MTNGHRLRVRERELVIPALRLAGEQPEGFITTAKLIIELEAIFDPAGRDAEILHGRGDTYFSQKVRNLISHRDNDSSFIAQSYAEYDEVRRGIRITIAGRKLLEQLDD